MPRPDFSHKGHKERPREARREARGRKAARREREQVPLAGEVTQGRSGAKANPPPGCGRRREAALQGDGRYSDQAMQAAFADECRAREKRRFVMAERRPRRSRDRKRANVTKNAPAS